MTKCDGPVAYDDLAVGDVGPEVIVEDISRVDIAKYAGASGDFTPIHVDEAFASEHGHPSVFAHGMLTAGIASNVVMDWFGVDAIRRYRVRFETQVWPGDSIAVTSEVTALHGQASDPNVNAEFVAENQDGEAVLTGDVSATVPSELH